MSKEWPIGQGQLLNQRAEKLPAICVDNKVVWINPNINAPFQLELGKKCDLGLLFLMRNTNGKQPSFFPEIRDGHNRSGILGRVVISDRQGNLYRDIDLKGLNMFGYTICEDGRENAPRGLLDYSPAVSEAKITEKLHSDGIPTYRVIAIMELHQLIDGASQPREVDWFKRQNIIRPDRTPVVSVRAFFIKTRLADIDYLDLDGTNYARNQVSPQFLDGLSLINQQHHLALDPQNPLSYLKWVAKTAGARLALFQRKGWCHGSLSQHNITFDARIADCASVRQTNDSLDFFESYRRLRQTLIEMGENVGQRAVKEILDIYDRSYNETI